MLLAWQQGIMGLRDRQVYASGEWPANKLFEGLSDTPPLKARRTAIGRSPLLATRAPVRRKSSDS
jgi:serine/threonine-protein kinase HipA